ncbi:MAG: hypothetical protein RLZZ303_1627 [Candidatus Hydrogenedentota bacterium]|jgi:lysophospholipase L1-like esterase
MSTQTAAGSPEPKRLGPVKTILYSLLPALALLLLLEGGARLREFWIPPMAVDLGQGFTADSLVFSPDPFDSDYRVTHPRKTINFQDQRFAAKKPAGTLRIVALGGSSVNYLDYEFSVWGERLKSQLPGVERIEIINCGGLSYGSHRLVLVAAEVLEYDPDLVMIYSGHNEFEELEQLNVAHVELVPVQRELERFATYRLLRDLAAWVQIRGLERQSRESQIAAASPDTGSAWTHTFTEEEIAGRMAAYRANLARIVDLSKARGVPVVIGTVPSNLWKFPPGTAITRWPEVEALYAAGRHAEGGALAESLLRVGIRHQSSESENEVIRALAREQALPLADVKAAVIAAEPHGVPGETLFNDHCHLNPEGNRILIQTYEPLVVDALRSRLP